MTSETKTSVPKRTASVLHQMTYGDFISMLSKLPQDAILYGDFSGYAGSSYSTYPEFKLQPCFHHDWDVEFNVSSAKEPVHVGDFLDFLLLHRGQPIPHNEGYLIEDETFIYVGVMSSNAGAIDGIRMNSDGSYSISATHPYA